MKALVRVAVIFAVATSFTVTAEAQPVPLEAASAVSHVTLSIATTTSAVGVLNTK